MLPKYSGDPNEDIEEWFYSLERYFEKAETPDDELVDFAEDFLTGSAKVAFRSLNAQHLNWKSFKTVFLEWFQPADYQAILRNKLIKLQQTNKIQDYIHEFDSITNNIKNMAEEDKITYFIRGLKPLTAGFVKQSKCKTLMDAKKEALSADNNFGGYLQSRPNNQQNNFKNNAFNYNRQTTQVSNSHNQRNDCNKNNNNSNNSNNNNNNSSNNNKNNNNKTNNNNKCFKCGNTYHPGLKCSEAKAKKAETINLARLSSQKESNDKAKTNNKTNNQSASDSHKIYNSITLNMRQKLLKVQAQINRVELDCVLDTGATKSVISEEIVNKYNIPIKKANTNITLANGEQVQAQTTELLPVIIKGRYCELSFVILPNRNINVLIGLD